MPQQLHYEVRTERRNGLTRNVPPGHEEQEWVANTSTLIWGDHDAVLVDTFATIEQNARLIEWIRTHDRRLATVYLTHGHGDHAFGVAQLRAAFPSVRVLATSGTLAALKNQASPELREGFWDRLFPGQIPPSIEFPEVLTAEEFDLEGHEVRVIETGHTDNPDSTVLWLPNLGLIAAGDVVYNATYPYLSETTSLSRLSWIAELERLNALEPQYVVSGHKDPALGDPPSDIAATIQYLDDVAETEATSSNAWDFYSQMLRKQPGRANIGSLWAATAMKGQPPEHETR
jgi:glyoxylase-like metal-dependent hydrolase (beta-lactamase superfamily II)